MAKIKKSRIIKTIDKRRIKRIYELSNEDFVIEWNNGDIWILKIKEVYML